MDIVIILPAKRKTEIEKEYTMQKQRTAKRHPLSCHESYSADAYLTSAEYIHYYLTATGTTAVFFAPL